MTSGARARASAMSSRSSVEVPLARSAVLTAAFGGSGAVSAADALRGNNDAPQTKSAEQPATRRRGIFATPRSYHEPMRMK
jgi:hypothetical protein